MRPNLRWKGFDFSTCFSAVNKNGTFGFCFGFSNKSDFSCLSIFGTIFLEESEEDVSLIFIEASLELGNNWRDFDSGEQDSLLSLEGNVLRPSDESSEISLGLDVISNSKVSGFGLEKGVSFLVSLLDSSLLSSFCLY